MCAYFSQEMMVESLLNFSGALGTIFAAPLSKTRGSYGSQRGWTAGTGVDGLERGFHRTLQHQLMHIIKLQYNYIILNGGNKTRETTANFFPSESVPQYDFQFPGIHHDLKRWFICVVTD